MNKFLCASLIIFLVACSKPQEEAKQTDLSNTAQMTTSQQEGLKSSAENNTSLLNSAKSYATCRAKVGFTKKLIKEKSLEDKISRIDKLHYGLIYLEREYVSQFISIYEIYRLTNSEYDSLNKRFEEIDGSLLEFVDTVIDECEQQYLSKINESCRGKEDLCFPGVSSANTNQFSTGDPKRVAEQLQIDGVSRCIAAATIMSAGLIKTPNIKADDPKVLVNNEMLQFYGAARRHLIQSINNPGVESAMGEMIRQQADYFGSIILSRGWGGFMPEIKKCHEYMR